MKKIELTGASSPGELSKNVQNIYLQPLIKYLRQVPFMYLYEIKHNRKKSVSIFEQLFTSIDKIFILRGRLGTRL